MASDGGQESQLASTPIYISWLTFITLLDWLRDMRVLPTQFDRSLWVGKFSGSVGGQIAPGLRFLRLLNGDEITPELERLALANNEERKPLLVEMLRRAYGEDLIDRLPRYTPKMLNERLESLGTTEGTHRKALSYFINAAKAVDLPMPGNIAKQARNKGPRTRAANSRTRSNGGHERDDAVIPQTPTPSSGVARQTPPGGGRASPPSASPLPLSDYAVIHATVGKLPHNGTWTPTERERWLTLVKAAVDIEVTLLPEPALTTPSAPPDAIPAPA